MAELISARADVARIEDHVRRALQAAGARGGEIADAAKNRLSSVVQGIDAAIELRDATSEAEALAWQQVLAEDANSDDGIGRVRDAMWNALGRVRQSPALDQVFPAGVSTYTAGDPRSQPVLMQVLESRLRSASAPQWTDASKEGWAAEIELLRTAYASAVDAHRPLEAAAHVADVGYRAAVRTGQARLRAFKRDLQNLGMTDAQIHEIIPDASSRTVRVQAEPDSPASGA